MTSISVLLIQQTAKILIYFEKAKRIACFLSEAIAGNKKRCTFATEYKTKDERVEFAVV
jgi:hypothetical protein